MEDFATGCTGAITFVIADLHFGDQTLCKKRTHASSTGRPFATAREMEMEIVRRWNSVVHKDDIVYILGDLGRLSRIDAVGGLTGRKHLVAGNGDNLRAIAKAGYFETISVARWLPGCLLTHIPVHPSQLRGRMINVHGHLHSAKVDDRRYRCVSVEQTGYEPVRLDILLAGSRHAVPI